MPRRPDQRRHAAQVKHEWYVKKTYGLEAGEYDKIREFQGGQCAICGYAKGLSRKLSVDHDHKTGVVRGLLCHRCNVFLGQIRDSEDAAARVLSYLQTPPAIQALGRVRKVPPKDERRTRQPQRRTRDNQR